MTETSPICSSGKLISLKPLKPKVSKTSQLKHTADTLKRRLLGAESAFLLD